MSTFGSEREKGKGAQNGYYTVESFIIWRHAFPKLINSKRLKWSGHGDISSTYRIIVRKPEGTSQLRTRLKFFSKKLGVEDFMKFYGSHCFDLTKCYVLRRKQFAILFLCSRLFIGHLTSYKGLSFHSTSRVLLLLFGCTVSCRGFCGVQSLTTLSNLLSYVCVFTKPVYVFKVLFLSDLLHKT